MTFLPILERELRAHARLRWMGWSRFALATAGMLVCVPELINSTRFFGGSFPPPGVVSSVGRTAFDGLVLLASGLSCAACLLTSDAISRERREGTLGLLLLTRVRTLDVLIGKLASLGITGLCGLLAFLPVLMVPLLAGGVPAGEAFRKGIVLLNTLLLALAVGLFSSSGAADRFRAGRKAVLWLSSLLFGTWLLDWLLIQGTGTQSPVLSFASPVVSLFFAGSIYATRPGVFWVSLAVQNALTWLFILLSGPRLRRAFREEKQVATSAWTIISLRFDPSAPAGRWQSAQYNSRPLEWMVRRQRGLKAAVWTAALCAALYPIVMMVFYGFAFRSTLFRGSVYLTLQLPSLAVSLLGGSLFAWAASRFFAEARRSGEDEMLLTTPVGAETIVSSQWTALKSLLRWPVLVMLTPVFLHGLQTLLPMFGPLSMVAGARHFYNPVSLLLSGANVVLAVAATVWLGLWFGWNARSQTAAIVWTVALSRGIPFLISTFGMSFLYLFLVALGGSGIPFLVSFGALSWLPQMLLLLFYLWAIGWAKRRLNRAFPTAAPKSFNLTPGLRHVRHWTSEVDGAPAAAVVEKEAE
jgi:hypothetical protein